MYGKKAIYFNYKSYGAFISLILVPALLILLGGSIAYMFLSLYPILFGVGLGIIIAFPGLPRIKAINANADIKLNKYKKALRKTSAAARLPFAPDSVKVFHAYLLTLNNNIKESDEKLDNLISKNLSYSEKAKWDAVKALNIWLKYNNPAEGIKYLEDKDRKGADEAILYVKGKLLNLLDDKSGARKYNEAAFELNQSNRDILSNLTISYCRTSQDRDAKIMFRTLYNDMETTKDALYFMAELKEKEEKFKDAVDFLKNALEIEEAATDIIKKDQIASLIERIEREKL